MVSQIILLIPLRNNYQFNEKKKLKAHIHPLSDRRRPDMQRSHHMMLHGQQTTFKTETQQMIS